MRWDTTPECREGVALLQARDANNAVPFLLEAHQIAHTLDPQTRAPDKAPDDARWREVMAQAFAAPVYDDYAKQYSELQRRVYVQHHESSLTQFADGMFASGVPQFGPARNYARDVLADNPQATIDFARRLLAGSNNNFEQYLASSLLLNAYTRSNQIKPGTISALQIASDKRVLTLTADRERTYWPMLDRLATVFQTIVLCLGISCAALVFLLALAGWQFARNRQVGNAVQSLLSVAAAGLGFCAVALLLVYHPYSTLIHGFLQNGNATSALAPWTYLELYHPHLWLGPTSAGWVALLVLCGIALLAVLGKAVQQHRATLKPVTP
jgi:hypothetical protein